MKNIDGKSLIIGLLTGIIAMLLMGSKTLESPGMYQMECNAELCFVMNTLNGVARSLTYSGLIRDRQNPLFTEMNERYLESNEITDKGVAYLASSERLPSLEVLSLHHNRIGDSGAKAMADSKILNRLRRLNLNFNEIGDLGAVPLVKVSNSATLENLHLSYNPLEKAGKDALLRFQLKQKFKNIRRLGKLNDLSKVYIGDVGLDVLLETGYLSKITKLNLSFNNLGDQVFADDRVELKGNHPFDLNINRKEI